MSFFKNYAALWGRIFEKGDTNSTADLQWWSSFRLKNCWDVVRSAVELVSFFENLAACVCGMRFSVLRVWREIYRGPAVLMSFEI